VKSIFYVTLVYFVVGDCTEQIEKNIKAPDGCWIVDCEEKILCPGFIDTHHHIWQTQLKGRHSDDTLLDYTPKGYLYPRENWIYGNTRG
jgi:cytosine/adenosine deaminase-related metal-dependent hydrolase